MTKKQISKKNEVEKRAYVRAKRVLSIQFRIHKTRRKNIDKTWQLSTTSDMSYGGVCFFTDQEYQIDDILELKIVMSGILDIFTGYGKVIRSKRNDAGAYYSLGVKFLDKNYEKRMAKRYTPTKKVSTKTKSKKRI